MKLEKQLLTTILVLFTGMSFGQISKVDHWDGSGTIKIRVKTCEAAESQYDAMNDRQVVQTSCGQDAEDMQDGPWIMVGGGADICCNSAATLQRNAPDTDELWHARSSDLPGNPPHELRPYIVLMQLYDDVGNAFVPETRVEDDNSNLCQPDVNGFCTSDGMFSHWGGTFDHLTLVGGGAQIVPEGRGYGGINESRPIASENGELAWRSGAKLELDDFTVRSWLIGIDLCPDEWNGQCLSFPLISEMFSQATSGRNSINYSIPPSWIPTSIGGQAVFYGNQVRYLEDLFPFNGTNRGLKIESKPGGSTNSGQTIGTALVLGRSAATYQYNAIRFNTAGTAFYRNPSSSSLWQTNQYPLGDRGRWHLQPVNNSEYLVRNGNPDEGFECAYWNGGNNVSVASCQENNSSFRWTKIGSNVFQLNNVASGTCIDNGNQGFTSSALSLQNCNSGYSAEQSLILDAYDWPKMPGGYPEITGKTFQLQFAHSLKCLDAFNNFSGANVGQWNCHGGENQKWKFNQKSGVYYEVIDVRDNLCLEVSGSSNQTGANIQVASCTGGDNQLFTPIYISEYEYNLQNKNSNLLLDVSGNSQSDGANVIQYYPTAGDNQKIIFSELASSQAPGFVCTGACLSAQPLSPQTNAVLNTTGERWYVVSGNVNGWQASEMAGRTIKVNGVTLNPGQMPLPAKVNGNYYFHFSSGNNDWASWSYWN